MPIKEKSEEALNHSPSLNLEPQGWKRVEPPDRSDLIPAGIIFQFPKTTNCPVWAMTALSKHMKVSRFCYSFLDLSRLGLSSWLACTFILYSMYVRICERVPQQWPDAKWKKARQRKMSVVFANGRRYTTRTYVCVCLFALWVMVGQWECTCLGGWIHKARGHALD